LQWVFLRRHDKHVYFIGDGDIVKKHIEKALENIGGNQSTLFPMDGPVEIKKHEGRKRFGSAKATYWICKNKHVFRHNYRITDEERKKNLKCPICDAGVQNQLTETTYKYYLKLTGRADAKEIRKNKLREEKKRGEKRKLLDD
jgi:hypothetical protein